MPAKLWLLLLPMIGGLISAGPGKALAFTSEANSTAVMINACRDRRPNLITSVCRVVIGSIMLNARELPEAERFCPPEAASADEGIRIVLSFVEESRLWNQGDFANVASAALRSTWPCQ